MNLINKNNIKISFYTLGCKVNYAETSTIMRRVSRYYRVIETTKAADIYIINTCAVTSKAEKDLKKIVKKILIININADIIVIGCYAQIDSKSILKIDGVSLVLGMKEKFNIIYHIKNLLKKKDVLKEKNTFKKLYSCKIEDINDYEESYSLDKNRTRSFLKIQDGCNYKCTYCTIPLARGTSRSLSINNLIINIKNILNNHIKEIVLTGINIGDYGMINNIRKYFFLDLIKAIDSIKFRNYDYRIRISSIEPNLITNEIIEFISKSIYFVPHFHIPLQSGSDYILNKMRRRYTVEIYKNKISKIKNLIPDCSIGVDVIVGFPGESEYDFLETYYLLKSLEVSYFHIFTFSERKNTYAANFVKDFIPGSVKNYRSKILRILSENKKKKFYNDYMNTKRKVLFEKKKKNNFIYGYTDNYIKVKHEWKSSLINTFQYVHLKDLDINDGAVLVDIC